MIDDPDRTAEVTHKGYSHQALQKSRVSVPETIVLKREELSVLTGTPHQVDFGGALLFIEDVGKPPYSLDRKLIHLYTAGALAGVQLACRADSSPCLSGQSSEPRPSRAGPDSMTTRRRDYSPLSVPGSERTSACVASRCSTSSSSRLISSGSSFR